jgi:hypothetical protein
MVILVAFNASFSPAILSPKFILSHKSVILTDLNLITDNLTDKSLEISLDMNGKIGTFVKKL